MEINKLQVFLEVLKHNNLTKTAETLGYTQSGITHIINSIENEVGFRLLKRSRSGVFPAWLCAGCPLISAELLEWLLLSYRKSHLYWKLL